jgi:phosphate transport system ATP-binding protein
MNQASVVPQTITPVYIASDKAPGQHQKVQIRNVNFYYGATHALKNISVVLHDKAVTAFIGPSGCGKSTLVRILNRIYEL